MKRSRRINYRALRLGLLRACLEDFLALFDEPTAERKTRWERDKRAYLELTDQFPLDLVSSAEEFRRKIDQLENRRRWLKLLESVREADVKLGNASAFYAKFHARSPFKNIVIISICAHLSPSRAHREEEDLQSAKTSAGLSSDAVPSFKLRIGFTIFAGFRKKDLAQTKAA